MLRDQISELRMQLIDKNARIDGLSMEMEAKDIQHVRILDQVRDREQKEHARLQAHLTELKTVFEYYWNER